MTAIADMHGRMPDPHAVYQDWLDVTSDALLTGAVDVFADFVSLPFVMRTVAGETVLESRKDLLLDARNVTEALRAQNVTNYIRLVKQAHYLEESVIEGWHTTHVLRNATNVVAPYGNRMILRRIEGIWRVVEADHELDGDRVPLMLLRARPGAFEDTWRAVQSDLRASYARAEPIYQAFLDSLARSVMENDFDEWCAHFTMPHLVHHTTTDHLIERPEDIRPFFDLLMATIARLKADRFERHARHAEFLTGDRILGYHDNYLHSRGEVVFGPVKSRMMLCQSGGGWRCSVLSNSLSNTEVGGPEFRISGELPTLRQIQERKQE